MIWSQKVFAYCERGANAAFWAEPLNALSNLAFFAAAFASLALWLAQPPARRGKAEALLILLVLAIGTGSFLFHTVATKWAALADTVPIGIFMVVYVVYALRRFLGLPWWGVALGSAAFIATLPPSSMVRCAGGPCFNGSVAYLPAFATLLVVGGALALRQHPAASNLVFGASLFAASLVFRTIDKTVCPMTLVPGLGAIGTHFLWHACNGLLLYLLVRAAILHGPGSSPARAAVA